MNKKTVAFSVICALPFACSDDSPELEGVESAVYEAPAIQQEPTVVGYRFIAVEAAPAITGAPFAPPAPRWPEAAAAELAVPDPAGQAGASVQLGALGVRVEGMGAGAPRRIEVETLDRAATAAAGVEGVVLRVARADGGKAAGAARLTVDYGAFRWAFGGDWASRLALWSVPACAVTTPEAPGCQRTRLASTNHASAGTVSAVVDVSADGALVAVSAAGSGPGGSYQATSLAPAATWSAGGNAGDFGWSYPLRLPPGLGGPVPKIAFGYSSSSIDGRMASTNNQASWIGEGFDWQAGSIERRYNGCADDMGDGANNTVKTGDLCWETDNAALSLAGHAGELLKDATDPNLWHLRNSDGTRVERRTGGPNDDDNGEWWVATTRDGTQYWFGGRAGSNAALTVPVFGNHTGEPCRQAAFKDSSCRQGYRWMLDHVVDPLGNTMSLTYGKDTNKYGKNNKPEDDTVYDRDGYVTKIEYGTRNGVSGAAPMRVLFEVADRCFSGCTTKDALHWPDVPWDRECTAATCGLNQTSPSFWTTKRLRSIKAQVWGGTDYRDVESWTLTHSFPSSDQPALWLDKIAHSGLVGGTESVPDITFAGVAMANRVDTNDDQFPAMLRYRMRTIQSETGGKLDVTYTPQDCIRGTRVPDPNAQQNNVLRCYPVKWQPEGQPNPINDNFHKYLVTDVIEADLSGSSSRVRTHYDYLGDPAWHYTDDDGFIKKDYKTWSVWRGYGAVRTTKGDPGEQTVVETRYFRGMHGDKLPSGTRTVALPAIAIGNVPATDDEDAYAGQVRETITFDGAVEISASASQPWQSAPKATRTINGSTVHARSVDTKVAHSRTALDGGRGHRTTSSTTTFDELGLPTQVDDRGDEAVAGDEKCTITDYVRNTGAWIVDRKSRERSYAVSCARVAAGGLTEAEIIGDTRTSYDGLPWGSIPVEGGVTKVEILAAFSGGMPSYLTANTYVYDDYGRKLEAVDIRGARTTYAYQPTGGGPLTSTVETSPLGGDTTTLLEPAWGLPLSTTDANGQKVELAYDALGRLTSVWLPGRDRASKSPSIHYAYLVRTTAPTVITTQRLNPAGGYITSYKLYDNLMRDRQTQEPDQAGGPGAVVTDTFYDSAGREVKLHDRYLAVTPGQQPVAPSTDLFVPTQNIPRLKVKQHDGASRVIAVIEKVNGPPASPGGTELSRTTTAYGGDRIDTTPPHGGTATSAIDDADGSVVERREYHAGQAPGSPSGYDRTRFEYNAKNELAAITDSAGNTWRYTYDLRGRKTQEIDPDRGTIQMTYTPAGDLETTKDGRNITIAYTYDALGRKTSMRDGSTTGPKRAEWIYDTLTDGTSVKGHLVKTIRYAGTDEYIKEHLGYGAGYEPTSVRYTIPASTLANGVHGAFTYTYTYNEDNSTATTRLPGLGDTGLGLETLTHGYNSLGKPTTLRTSLGTSLVEDPDPTIPGTQYTSLGELAAIHLQHNAGARADVTRFYDASTRRLARIWTTRATGSTTVADVWYSHDESGNVTKISDVAAGDHQCFRTDHLRRLATAWTPATGDCDTDPSAPALGGPATYWHKYEYDALGNRTRLLEYATSAGDRETTYTVPAGAHRLTGTTTVDNTGTRTRAYTYDASGNVWTRPTPSGGTQTLTWDPEGKLATSTDTTGTTTLLYDADGNRLLRVDPTGKTLYLPGQELRFTTATGAKRVTRYYSHAGEVIAMRSVASGVVWLAGDHHGTSQVAINAVGQAVAIRRETPFGELRGTTGTWPSAMDKGFVGGTNDNTGLTHLGARMYDPLIGRFISVDPVISHDDPQQMHGYSYANNAPVTASDPDGLWPTWVKQAASAVHNTVQSTGKFVYDHAGTISTIASVAAIACTVIPPLQAIAPVFGAVAAVTGAIDTYKTCKNGSGLDCAVGVAGMIPGGRALKVAGEAASGIFVGGRALKAAGDGLKRAKDALADLNPFRRKLRPATEQPVGGNGVVLRDGEGATAAELRASRGGETGGVRGSQERAARDRMLRHYEDKGEPYLCWRCGHTSRNPADMHLAHRNSPASRDGNLSRYNVCLEGAACNLSAGNRGGPSPGMSCAERGGCGAPYGRFDRRVE